MDIVIFTVPAVLAISNSSFASISDRVPKCICFMMRFSCWPRPALLSYTKNGQNEAIAKETRQKAVMSAATKKGTSQSFVPCKLKCVLGAFDFNEIHATTTTTTTRERTTQTSWACLACQEKEVWDGRGWYIPRQSRLPMASV